jgi:hypothetical protein
MIRNILMFRRALAGIAVTLLVLGLLPQSYVPLT